MTSLQEMFAGDGFMPHGMCYLWQPDLLWLHVLSDGIVALAYFAIPPALLWFVLRARKTLPPSPTTGERRLPHEGMLVAFGAFIVACGLTHVMGIWTIWEPRYWLSGGVKGATAFISISTAVALPPLLPRLLELVRSARVSDRRRKELAAANQLLTRQGQRLEQSNNELESFAYVAAHELQEPVRTVTSFCRLLGDRYEGQLDDQGRRYIDLAVDGAERMQEMIHALLEYSRVQSGGLPLAPVELDSVVEAAEEQLAKRIAETGARIRSDALPTVRGDANQLTHVFRNLISNAIRYRSTAAPEIRISADRESNGWRIAVEDNGIGIEAEYQQKIFGMFERLHAKSDRRGTGIGLAICQRVVERHGGRIWVSSTGDGGSTFYLTLLDPAVPTPDAERNGTEVPELPGVSVPAREGGSAHVAVGAGVHDHGA